MQQTWTNCLTSVHGNDSRSPIGMLKKVMTPADAHNLKSQPAERRDQFTPSNAWKLGHGLDGDPLETDEGWVLLSLRDLEAQLDGFADASHEDVEGSSLSVTTSQFRNARDKKAIRILLNQDAELAVGLAVFGASGRFFHGVTRG